MLAVKIPLPRIYVSELAHVEVLSTLYKIERVRGYSSAFTDTAINMFKRDVRLSAPARRYNVFDLVPLTSAVLALANTLLERYRTGTPFALRSLDAIQLASADLARSTLPASERTNVIFVTADRQLFGVAAAEGFQTINPEFPPLP